MGAGDLGSLLEQHCSCPLSSPALLRVFLLHSPTEVYTFYICVSLLGNVPTKFLTHLKKGITVEDDASPVDLLYAILVYILLLLVPGTQ